MNLLDRVKLALGFEPAKRLVDFPDEYRQVAVEKLAVHTANLSPDTDEKLVVVTLPQSALEHLSLLDAPLQLTSPNQRPVTWVPVDRAADPLLDPNLGWIIPVTPSTAAELAGLPTGPGAYELESLHLGLVVE